MCAVGEHLCVLSAFSRRKTFTVVRRAADWSIRLPTPHNAFLQSTLDGTYFYPGRCLLRFRRLLDVFLSFSFAKTFLRSISVWWAVKIGDWGGVDKPPALHLIDRQLLVVRIHFHHFFFLFCVLSISARLHPHGYVSSRSRLTESRAGQLRLCLFLWCFPFFFWAEQIKYLGGGGTRMACATASVDWIYWSWAAVRITQWSTQSFGKDDKVFE